MVPKSLIENYELTREMVDCLRVLEELSCVNSWSITIIKRDLFYWLWYFDISKKVVGWSYCKSSMIMDISKVS